MRERLARLRELDLGQWLAPPPGLDSQANAVLQAPEGTALLFLEEQP